jgi:hypothetical protein
MIPKKKWRCKYSKRTTSGLLVCGGNETEILDNFAVCLVATDRIAILGATVFFLKNFEELRPTRR